MASRIIFFVLFVFPCNGQASSGNDPLQTLARLLAASEPTTAFQSPAAAGALARGSRGAVADSRSATPRMSAENLQELAKSLNPIVGYWDPMGLGKQNFWGQGNEATVGFLRHAEIKHGRVAMAAFVGYCLQANGAYFPYKLSGDVRFEDIAAAGSPPEQWDALPTSAKAQILIFIGFLEAWSETASVLKEDGNAHYMRGGVPGKFPSFRANTREGEWPDFKEGFLPHKALDLYDPFSINKGKSREVLDRSLLAEINNGRLAMLGIMAFLSEQKAPGAVPLLNGLVGKYAGEPMAAFSSTNADLPLVNEMLNTPLPGNLR